MSSDLIVYTDYKSPYGFLAKDLILEFARESGVVLDWRPYTLDIPSYLGSARVDDQGNVLEADRTPHQWRRVRYGYKHARRLAKKRGLVLRGTRRIYDSSTAAIGLLYAQAQDAFPAYHDEVFARFWSHDLDIEDAGAIAGVLARAGADTDGFPAYLEGEGRREHDRMRAEAEDMGVFGVPSFLFEGELFWGAETLPLIADAIAG